ncbi:MAG: hypothetical protein K6G90_03060 [Clostridia bacterium]|nr:hypothetical protein [Clostridia bacterium]
MRPMNGEPVYRLIHSQEMVQYMWRYTLHTQATQIPASVSFDEQLDFGLLARAMNAEIERNDCLRLRIFRDKLTIKQFFLKEYRLDRILLKEFDTKEERERFFDRDASTALKVFGGETFRVVFFRERSGRSGIYINVSHMVMDFIAVFTFFKDLMAVYDSLRTGDPPPRPLSRYEDIVKKEQDDPVLEERLENEGKLLAEWVDMGRRPVYNAINGPAVLDRQSRLLHKKDLNMPFVYMPLRDSTRLLKLHLSDKDSDALSAFVEDNRLSAEWVIQLALRLYLSKINHGENDTLFWVLCPRRKTVKEKRCGGTLASPMPWREIFPETLTFSEAIAQMARTQAFLFRHSDVPFTIMRNTEMKLWNLSLMQSPNSMMYSHLPSDQATLGGRRYEFTGYDFGHYVIPVYVITMREPESGQFVFSYIHRLWLTSDGDVRRFHDGVVRTLLAGIASPDKTLKEIMEEI